MAASLGFPAWLVPTNGRLKKPYRGNSVYHSFKKGVEAARKHLKELGRTEDAKRLAGATFHTLRHTFASWCIQKGKKMEKVQQYLGHTGDHMTRRYVHLAPVTDEDRNALEILSGKSRNPVKDAPTQDGTAASS